MTPTTSRLLAGIVGLVGTVVLALPMTAGAQTTQAWSSYEIRATATAIRIDTAIPGAPPEDHVLAAESPRARAIVDSLGRSDADAAAVAPGDTIRSLRGVAANLASGPLPVSPVPDVPLVAESSHPTVASKTVAQPPVVLQATSEPTTSTGSAGWTGALSSGLTTATATGAGDRPLEAEATAEVSGFVAGPVTIAQVTSRATVRRRPGGELERETDVAVAGATVNGIPVAIDQRRPFVTDAATIRFLEVQQTDRGVVAPGVEVTIAVPASFTEGASEVVFTLGRAEASARAVAAPPRPEPATKPTDPIGPAAAPTGPVAAPTAAAAPAANVVPSPPRRRVVPATPVVVPALSAAGLTTDTPGADVVVAAPIARPAPLRVVPTEPWATQWYLPLVAVAMAIGGGFMWFRRAGVRGTWI